MSLEIERKFLVTGEYKRGDNTVQIEQGYIFTGNPEVRIRCTVDQGGDGTYEIFVKAGKGMTRTEKHKDITASVYYSLFPGLPYTVKVRSHHQHLNATIELDEFSDALEGLVMAEVEFQTEISAHLWLPPSWLGQEVTHDERYKNQWLAENGIPN